MYNLHTENDLLSMNKIFDGSRGVGVGGGGLGGGGGGGAGLTGEKLTVTHTGSTIPNHSSPIPIP